MHIKDEKKHLPNLLAQIKSGRFHHAYLLKNFSDDDYKNVTSGVKEILGKKLKSEDFFEENIENLGIKESRNLKDKAQITPLGEYKTFFLKISSVTREAENALLKLFEEPPAGSIFFIFSKNIGLSKILLSRMVVIEGELEIDNEISKKIFSLTVGEKIEWAKKIADKSKEDETKEDIISLLNSIEKEIIKKIGINLKTKDILKEIEQGKSYLKDRSAGAKMILENIFINIHRLFKNS